jgi:hypothetical protein
MSVFGIHIGSALCGKIEEARELSGIIGSAPRVS